MQPKNQFGQGILLPSVWAEGASFGPIHNKMVSNEWKTLGHGVEFLRYHISYVICPQQELSTQFSQLYEYWVTLLSE